MDSQRKLISNLQKASQVIQKASLRGNGNYMLVSN